MQSDKGQILKKYEAVNPSTGYVRLKKVKMAMDEYAKQQSIAFIIWAVENHSIPFEGFSLNTFTDNREPEIFLDGEEAPVSKLYEKFAETISQ